MAGYDTETDLRALAALSPEEQARSDALEASPANQRELASAIANERDPGKRRVLMEIQSGSRAAPAPTAGGLDRFLDGGAPAHGGSRLSLDDFLDGMAMPEQAPPPSSTLRRVVGDTAVSAVKGAVGLVESGIGLADLATGGHAGQFLENEGGAIGVRPKQAQAYLDTLYSPEQQQANQAVQQADGVLDTVKAAIQHPSVIFHSAVQSLPQMVGGGVTGRALIAGAERVGARVAPTVAGAVGEGVVTAGSQAESIRQQTADGLITGKQALLAGGSGALTGALGGLSARVAKALGIADVDTMLAGKGSPEVTQSFLRRVLEGAVTEGLLEELPQSVQEQVAQNLALGKPLGEGVPQAAVLGALTGAAMGAGGNALAGNKTPAGATRDQKVADPAGPLARAVNNGLEAQAKAQEVQQGLAEAGAAVQPPAETLQSPAVSPNEAPAAAPEPATAVDAPAAAAPALDPEANLAALHEQASREAQGLRDFGTDAAPPAAVQPARVVAEQPQPSDEHVLGALARETPQPVDPNDIRQALDDLGAQERATADLYRDVLNREGKPFTNIGAAQRKQREVGGEVVPADGGGFVVRVPEQPAATSEPAAPVSAPAADIAAPADAAVHETAATSPHNDIPEPTQAQKEAGNYKVGRMKLGGLDLSIENPQGSVRRGTDRDGKAWENTLQHHYGYIRRSEGNDGDHVDAFVKPGTPEDWDGTAFVVDQVHPDTGAFDEHKALLGFDTEQEAAAAYAANYAKDWKGGKAITAMPFAEFKTWVMDREATKRPLAQDVKQEPAPSEQAPEAGEAAPAAAPEPQAADAGGAAPEGQARRPAAERPAEVQAAGVSEAAPKPVRLFTGKDGAFPFVIDREAMMRERLAEADKPLVQEGMEQEHANLFKAAGLKEARESFDAGGHFTGKPYQVTVNGGVYHFDTLERAKEFAETRGMPAGRRRNLLDPNAKPEPARERRKRLSAEKDEASDDAKPWHLPQEQFVKALTYKKDGARWSAYWKDAQIEGGPEALNHPDIGRTMTMGARFFRTKGEAQYAAMTAHKRAVRRALMNGEKVEAKVLEDYPDLKEAAAKEAAKAPTPALAPAEPVAARVEPKKRSTAAQRAADERAAKLADYFTPGNILKAYGGFDEVLEYKAPTVPGGAWSVKVQRVIKRGTNGNEEWVREGKPQDARWHSTAPDARELATGPVARLAHVPGGQVAYTEPRADGAPFPNAPDRGVAPAPAPEPAPAPALTPEASREVIELRKRASVLSQLKACLAS